MTNTLTRAHSQIATNLSDLSVMLSEMHAHVARIRIVNNDSARPDRAHVINEISDEMLNTLAEIVDVLGVEIDDQVLETVAPCDK